MPNLNVLFKKLSSSKELRDFKKKNKGSFLVACFFVVEGGEWQFDYYNPKDKLITTFEVSNRVKVIPADKVFESQESKILELDFSKVKVDFDSAIDCVKKFVASEYPDEKFFTKTIVILQNLKGEVIWNVTLLTSTLKLINVKVGAVSGEVLSHSEESFLSMR